jgi:hypothetical protein
MKRAIVGLLRDSVAGTIGPLAEAVSRWRYRLRKRWLRLKWRYRLWKRWVGFKARLKKGMSGWLGGSPRR